MIETFILQLRKFWHLRGDNSLRKASLPAVKDMVVQGASFNSKGCDAYRLGQIRQIATDRQLRVVNNDDLIRITAY